MPLPLQSTAVPPLSPAGHTAWRTLTAMCQSRAPSRLDEMHPTPHHFDLVGFARALDRQREAQGLSWREVADAAGVHKATLSRVAVVGTTGDDENCVKPSLEVALALATWLGQPLEGFWKVVRPRRRG